jgi:hypothetical protein
VAAGFRYTIRIWMRAGNSTSAAIGFLLGSFVTVTPSIVSGPGSVSGTTVCTVTGLTSAWTQVQMVLATTTSAGTGGFYIYPNAVANSIGDSIHLWGAQMNIGTASNPYYTTTANPYYAPRFDHNPTTGSPRGLLIEAAATNSVFRSQTLNSTPSWNKAGAVSISITGSGSPANDSTSNVLTWTNSTLNGNAWLEQSLTVTGTQAYTWSVWLKPLNNQRIAVYGLTKNSSNTIIGNIETTVNFSVSPPTATNTVTSGYTSVTTPTLTEYPNGWYRMVMTGTTPATAATTTFGISNKDTVPSTGTNGCEVWGPQFETGSVATSYIPTGGSTGNRTAESLSLSPSTWYFPTYSEGTFYFRGSILNTATGYTRLFALTASSSVVTATGTVANFNIGVAASNSNRPFLNTFNTSNNDVDIYVPVGAAVSNNVEFGVTAAYKSGDWRISSKNLAATSTYATVSYATWGNNLFLSGINTIQLPAIWYKHLKFYPIRLPNSQMDTLSA